LLSMKVETKSWIIEELMRIEITNQEQVQINITY